MDDVLSRARQAWASPPDRWPDSALCLIKDLADALEEARKPWWRRQLEEWRSIYRQCEEMEYWRGW